MKLLGKPQIKEFMVRHAKAKGPLRAWAEDVESADWKTTHDIKQRYVSSNFLPGNIVIFNIGDNKFRLEVKAQYHAGVILVLGINTHTNFDIKN